MKVSLFGFTGQIALITGASRGLGFVLAKGLCEAGAAVMLNGKSERCSELGANPLLQPVLSGTPQW